MVGSIYDAFNFTLRITDAQLCDSYKKNGVNISFLFQLPSRTKQPEKDTEDNVMECDAAVISTNGRPGRDVSTNHGAAFFFNEFRHRISSWKLLRASLGELNVDTNTKAWFIKCFPNR